MLTTVIDPNGISRQVYVRPPQAFVDAAEKGIRLSETFVGCKLTPLGMEASLESCLAWLAKRDEWRPE